MMNYDFRDSLLPTGHGFVCGVDEAGRGPLAGPVCAAAVILPEGYCPELLNDSKKLSAQKRESLFEQITANALSYGIAFASVEEIEEYNILNATFLAMNRAISALEPVPSLAMIDGNRNSKIQVPSICVVKGDSLIPEIAAASILAKVTRDRLMTELDREYPGYGFAKHKGYGTKEHYDAIHKYGVTPIHRPSFLRKMH